MDARSKRSVLIVEDDPTWAVLYKGICEEHGYATKVTLNRDDALAALARQFFCVALIDIRLHERDQENRQGMDVLERIRQLGEPTQCIVITGYGTPEIEKEALREYERNVHDYLTKQKYDEVAFRASLRETMAEAEKRVGIEVGKRVNAFLSEIVLGKIIESVPAGERRGLMEGFQTVFGEVFPLVPSRERPKVVTDSMGKALREATYWSRALGEAILVKVGRWDLIVAEKEDFAQHPGEYRGYARQLAFVSPVRRVSPKRVPHLAGAVYTLKMTLEEFLQQAR